MPSNAQRVEKLLAHGTKRLPRRGGGGNLAAWQVRSGGDYLVWCVGRILAFSSGLFTPTFSLWVVFLTHSHGRQHDRITSECEFGTRNTPLPLPTVQVASVETGRLADDGPLALPAPTARGRWRRGSSLTAQTISGRWGHSQASISAVGCCPSPLIFTGGLAKDSQRRREVVFLFGALAPFIADVRSYRTLGSPVATWFFWLGRRV